MSGTADFFNIVEETGNLNVDPRFRNDFLFADITSGTRTKSTIVVKDTSSYQPGDHIEYDNDGIMRKIVFVGKSEVLFTPALAGPSDEGKFVYYWGPKTNPAEDYHLEHVSPCIDAGDPVSNFSNEPEPNGGQINIGAYGNTVEASTTLL